MALTCVSSSHAKGPAPDWQAEVRKYAEAKDWDSALRLVEQQIARAAQDMDVRAWRARVLGLGRKTSVDQIGSFASQAYGGGLRLQITDGQDIAGFWAYQRRTQNRTDTSFGLSYGIHF